MWLLLLQSRLLRAGTGIDNSLKRNIFSYTIEVLKSIKKHLYIKLDKYLNLLILGTCVAIGLFYIFVEFS